MVKITDANDPVPENDAEKNASYFSYYGQLTHQANMLQDTVRTLTYQMALSAFGPEDIAGRRVMDVGAGSGILSFFAAQAGGREVVAVEAAAGIVGCMRELIRGNGCENVIRVVEGMVEKIADEDIGGPVDAIVSEPMGVLLVHERMIESYIEARDRWLRPFAHDETGSPIYSAAQMFPSSGAIFLAPFSDAALYASTKERVKFWETGDFFGVKLSPLAYKAKSQYFSHPIVGGVDPNTLMAGAVSYEFPFYSITKADLQNFEIKLEFEVAATGICHGLAGWFDVEFAGSNGQVIDLSTAPDKERTHWHQVRFLFRNPLALNRGQRLNGLATFKVNDQRSYDIDVELAVEGADVSARQSFALHDQQYWNLNGIHTTTNLDYLSIYPEQY
jgi:histone-arginine methyltransferase CARM1